MDKLKLPSMEHTFYLDCKGNDTGEQYRGDFTYVRPNIGTQIEIGKSIARYNGDLQSLEEEVKILNQIRATLLFCLKESPDWWKQSSSGATLYDSNVVTEIYIECMKFEKQWHNKVWSSEEQPKTETTKA